MPNRKIINLPKNNNSIFKGVLIAGLFFLIAFLNFPLLADNLPLKVDCKNHVCDCYRLADTKSIDIDKITVSINEGLITDSILIACCYHQIALEYYENYDDLSSLKYNKKAKEIREKRNDGLLWRSHLNIAFNYYELNEYKLASLYFKKALTLPGEKEAFDSLTIFKNLAEYYLEIGDFETAIDFAEQSIQFNVDQTEKNLALNTYSSILISSQDSINLITAKEFGTKAFELSKMIQDYENMKIALSNLAEVYMITDSVAKAIALYKGAIKLSNNSDTINEVKLLNNLANSLFDKKEFNLAINTLSDSYDLLSKYYQADFNYEYAAYHENLADIYTNFQQLDTSLFHYQKTLINLTNNFRDVNIFQNPYSRDTSLFIYSNPDMIRVLHLKATTAYKYYQQNNNLQYLNLANQSYQTAFDFHDQLQKEISTENSRLFQAKNIVPYIENALKVAYQLQESGQNVGEAAFRFMEKNKATVLLQSMNEADALQYANLPDSLLNQERDLKIAITFHNKQLNEAIEYEDTTEIERLENLLFEEQQQYSQLISNLENNYPNYYQLKYQQNQTQLKDVQTQLADNTALIEYFVGDSSIYTLLILKDSTQLFKTKKPADWEEQINNFREAFTLSNREDLLNKYNKKLFKKFVTNGNALYQYLLEEPLKELHQISQLKIIPDAKLNYIPFDLLLTNAVDTSSVNYKNLPYLLKQKTISYAYSAALMMEQQATGNTKKDFAYGGYAPKYDHSTNSDLPKARELVKNMASFFRGKKHLDKTATKANFLKDSLNYQILHLAMHGKLDDLYPLNSHLVFSNHKKNTPAKSVKEDYQLYASDLYLHEINADLTILNACETGAGELQKGEGVMSLSRAFTYAGCPSLMMSLWSIDEQPSAKILETFFKNIKKGSSKDVAIRQAKLDYLNNTKANFSHPYYWAGLVLTGNTEALQLQNPLNWLWWVLVLTLVLPVVYLIIKILSNRLAQQNSFNNYLRIFKNLH